MIPVALQFASSRKSCSRRPDMESVLEVAMTLCHVRGQQ